MTARQDPVFPSGWTAFDVRTWLLRTYKEGHCDPIPLSVHLDPSVAIQGLCDRSPVRVQEVIKAGAVLALQEWRRTAHGYPVLEDLCYLIALLKCTAAIPILDSLVRSAVRGRRGEAADRALSAVVASICGFAPHRDVHASLHALFYDRDCPPVLAAQLFNGLAICEPDGYWRHVSRFFELKPRSPKPIVDVAVGMALVDCVSSVTLFKYFDKLSNPELAQLWKCLEQVPDSQLHSTINDDGIVIWHSTQPHTKISVPTMAGETLLQYAHTFRSRLQDFKRHPGTDVLLQAAADRLASGQVPQV
jgi:hypothetical protein